MQEYTDALLGVHIAKPLHDGYIATVARINLGTFLAENPLPYANDTYINVTDWHQWAIDRFHGKARWIDQPEAYAAWAEFTKTDLFREKGSVTTHTHASEARGGVGCALSKGTKTNAPQKTTSYDDSFPIDDNIFRNPYISHDKKGLPYHPTDAHHCVRVQVGVQDIKVSCLTTGGAIPQVGGGVRQAIVKWSDKSRRACEHHIRNLSEGACKVFLTLTYPESFPVDGEICKKHLHAMKQWFKRRGISGVWFLEFQRRGAPHFHAFLDKYPLGGSESVAVAWDRIVSSGDPKHIAWHRGELSGRPCLEYMRKPHAASWYASKYATKAEQKEVPENFINVGRFWGHWGKTMKPVFTYLYARGYTAYCVGLHAIIDFRIARGISKPCNPVTHYTSVLRGAMVEGFAYWLPDDMFFDTPF